MVLSKRGKDWNEGYKQGALEELEKIRKKIINHDFKRISFGEYLPVSKRNIIKYIDKRLKEKEWGK